MAGRPSGRACPDAGVGGRRPVAVVRRSVPNGRVTAGGQTVGDGVKVGGVGAVAAACAEVVAGADAGAVEAAGRRAAVVAAAGRRLSFAGQPP